MPEVVSDVDDDDVEEVNYSSSDSDIMEVDAEDSSDPLATPKVRKGNSTKSIDNSTVNDKIESVVIEEVGVNNVESIGLDDTTDIQNEQTNIARPGSSRRQSQEKSEIDASTKSPGKKVSAKMNISGANKTSMHVS